MRPQLGKCFDGCAFAMCGKTITSLRRNVVTPLLPMLSEYGFAVSERVSGNYFDITLLGRTNRVYLFGGRDESSAALIQGMTLAGVFFDEVALMPRSFVEQALHSPRSIPRLTTRAAGLQTDTR